MRRRGRIPGRTGYVQRTFDVLLILSLLAAVGVSAYLALTSP